MNAKLKAALASYGRSVLSAAVALYLSGVTDPGKLLAALVAGLLPVAIRYFNPKDAAFGKVAEVAVANLSKGESVIPKEYIEKNKEAIQKIVKAVVEEKKAAAKPAAKPVAKPTTKPAAKPAPKNTTPKK